MHPKIRFMPHKNIEEGRRYRQLYREKNKEEITRKQKLSYQKNKEHIQKARHDLYINNVEIRKKVQEGNQKYWKKNKEILSQKNSEWRKNHKEYLKEYQHKYNPIWYQKNKDKKDAQGKIWSVIPENKIKRVKYVQKYVENNLEKVKSYRKCFEQTMEGKYRQLIWRAKHFSGTPITLERFIVLMSQSCVYCGDKGRVGIDRVDNLQGYTLENSSPSCRLCNFMKKAMTVKDFLEHVKKIHNHNLN